MSGALKLGFAPFSAPAKGVLVVFCEEGLKFGAGRPQGARADRRSGRARRGGRPVQGQERLGARHRGAARARRCRGWSSSGVGKARDLKAQDFVKLGGIAMGKVPSAATRGDHRRRSAGRRASSRSRSPTSRSACELRAYAFDRYKTKRKEGEEQPAQVKVTIAVAERRRGAEGVRAARARSANGVVIARDLVNEPANVLYPEEFARRAGSAEEARRRGRGARRQGDEEARHERAARRRAGLAAREPHGGHALERRQDAATRRSPSSARACASTPAASRSSRRPAWRT